MEIKTKFKTVIKFAQLFGLLFVALIFMTIMHKIGNFVVNTLNLAPMTTFWIGLSIPMIIATAFGILIMVMYGHEFWADEWEDGNKKK